MRTKFTHNDIDGTLMSPLKAQKKNENDGRLLTLRVARGPRQRQRGLVTEIPIPTTRRHRERQVSEVGFRFVAKLRVTSRLLDQFRKRVLVETSIKGLFTFISRAGFIKRKSNPGRKCLQGWRR